MARFSGKVGFAPTTVETALGVHEEQEVEKAYKGDVLRLSNRSDVNNTVNPDISVSNRISIVADAYANENFLSIRYVEWMGVRWEVVSVEVRRPRLILSLGGRYNG
jgi:hypothetical protein